MDLIDWYIQEEPDHVPSLLIELNNVSSHQQTEIISNLFNFKVDFVRKEVVIEDDCGLFCDAECDREMTSSLSDFINRLWWACVKSGR